MKLVILFLALLTGTVSAQAATTSALYTGPNTFTVSSDVRPVLGTTVTLHWRHTKRGIPPPDTAQFLVAGPADPSVRLVWGPGQYQMLSGFNPITCLGMRLLTWTNTTGCNVPLHLCAWPAAPAVPIVVPADPQLIGLTIVVGTIEANHLNGTVTDLEHLGSRNLTLMLGTL